MNESPLAHPRLFAISLVTGLMFIGCSRDARPPEGETRPTSSSATPSVSGSAPTSSATPASASAAPAGDSGATASTEPGEQPMERTPDIEYVPTPQNVVDKMLEVAKIQKDDVLYDLGCGDGRIVVTAAKKFGIKTVGYDIDPQRVKEARANVKKNGVENLVAIEQKDIFTLDLTPATVVTLYLLPELNVKLIPQLEKLRPGARIISHDFDMAGVEPENKWTIIAKDHA